MIRRRARGSKDSGYSEDSEGGEWTERSGDSASGRDSACCESSKGSEGAMAAQGEGQRYVLCYLRCVPTTCTHIVLCTYSMYI